MINAKFRSLFKFAVPGWLQNPEADGERVLYSLGKLCDMFAEKALRGLEARFPARAPASANALTAGDRGILRGRDESVANFAARLQAWRLPRTHRVRGNAYEAVRQVWNYWQSWFPGYADVFDSHFLTHSKDANGDELRADFGTWNWDGADPNVDWARFWVTIDNDGIEEQLDFGDPLLWGGALGTPGYTLGQLNVRIEDVIAMRSLFQELGWGPGHAQPEWVIVTSESIGGGAFPAPNGTWNFWSKDDAGARVAARSALYRYWSLMPEYNNMYGGDRTRPWPIGAQTVDDPDVYFTGDRTAGTSFDEQTLPNGALYTGVRTRWTNRVLLPDDGSIPK